MIQYPHAKCLTTANVWLISKKSTHFSRVYLSPLGCISPTALWHSPTWLLSCCFCSMTKSLLPQLYPWIWITNTVCTYIYEIQLILPPHTRWEEACQSDWVVSRTLGNLGCGATAEMPPRLPHKPRRHYLTNVQKRNIIVFEINLITSQELI